MAIFRGRKYVHTCMRGKLSHALGAFHYFLGILRALLKPSNNAIFNFVLLSVTHYFIGHYYEEKSV